MLQLAHQFLLWDAGLVLALVLFVLLLPRMRQPGATSLAMLVASTAVWMAGDTLNLGVSDFDTKLLLLRVRYIGVATIPVAWFAFACQYSQKRDWVRFRNLALIGLIPAITFIAAWTSGREGLLWRRLWLDESWGIVVLRVQTGPWYWVHAGYSYVLILAGAVIVYVTSRDRGQHRRRQANLLLCAIAFPFVGNVAFQLGIKPAPYTDFTSHMLIITCAIFTWSFLRRGFLNPPLRFARDVVVQSMMDGVVVTDLDRTILDVNPAAQAMLAGGEDLRGRALPDWLAASDERLSKQGGFRAWDATRADATGKMTNYHVRVSPVHQKLVGHAGYVVVLQDVTERLRVESALRQAQKMEMVGQLAGGVAHDFNNLLHVMNGYTDLALQEVGPGHPAQSSLEEVRRAGERAAKVVGQLLAFSRRQVISPKLLDLNKVVLDLLKMLERVLGEHVRIKFVPLGALGMVYADSVQMEQVLMNLSVNARDAMPEGGTLTIETFAQTVDEEYCTRHVWARPGSYVGFSVADTGCGMDAETQAHIFDPFYTTKEIGKGTGLGLATVYGIVKQHDGMISVYSEPGKGSMFRVYLPLAAGPEAVGDSPTAEQPSGGGETILLAEDEATVRALTRRLLESAGYTVLDAQDGEEALQVAEKHPGKVSLAILDVVMPRLGGKAVYERLKEQFPEMRFLFASGYSAAAMHQGSEAGKDFDLIQKPFDRGLLLSKVRKALDGYRPEAPGA